METTALQVQPKVASKSESKSLDVFGVRVQVLLRADDTGGAFSTYYLECDKGTGAPDHVHQREDETFFVIDGEFKVRTGDRAQRVIGGEQVFLPRNVPHNFLCVSETGKLLGMAAPGGHELFFEDADALMASGRFSPETGAELCSRHGMEILPPLS